MTRHRVTAMSPFCNTMAKPLAVNRDAVRATYLATGSLTEAARLHGLKPNTVRQWAKRELWETATTAHKLQKKAEEIVELKREKGHSDVPSVSRTSDALARHLTETAATFRTNMAGALARSSGAIAELDAMSVLENSRRVLDLSNAASKIFPSMAEEPKVSVNLLSMGLSGLVSPSERVYPRVGATQ